MDYGNVNYWFRTADGYRECPACYCLVRDESAPGHAEVCEVIKEKNRVRRTPSPYDLSSRRKREGI